MARQGKDHPAERMRLPLTSTAPFVQRRVFGGKQVEQQVDGEQGVELDAGIEKSQTQIPPAEIQKDQGTAAVLGKASGLLRQQGNESGEAASARLRCRVNHTQPPVRAVHQAP